jgi:hypothetical protein
MSSKSQHNKISFPWRRRLALFWGDIEWPFIFFVTIFLLGLGVAGYSRYAEISNHPILWVDRFYYSAQLFTLNYYDVGDFVPWELQAARFLSPAVTGYALLQAALVVFRKQAQLLRLAGARNHVIIVGLGQKGLLLAREYKAMRKTVVVIEKNGSNPFLDLCNDLGAIVLIGDARDPVILTRARAKYARFILAVCKDDGDNAEVAFQARRLARTNPGHRITCIIHVIDPRLWTLLRERELNANPNQNFQVEFFNIYDGGARILVREYLPFDVKNPDPSTHVMLIGLEDLGESLIVQLARKWAPIFDSTGARLVITVIDPESIRKVEAINGRYPLVSTVTDLQGYCCDIDWPEFQQGEFFQHTELSPPVSHVYVCLEDTSVSLTAGLMLLKLVRAYKVQILIRLSEDAGLASFLREVKGFGPGHAKLQAFGLLDRTCKPGLFDDGTHETLARVIHEEYCEFIKKEIEDGNNPEYNPDLLKPWEQLPEFKKDSNRAQADRIGRRLITHNYGITPWCDYGADKFEFMPEELEALAQGEHERWCAEIMDAGWRYGPVRSSKEKTHSALLPWDDKRLAEAQKDKDRNAIREIPQYLARAGFQIYRYGTTRQIQNMEG